MEETGAEGEEVQDLSGPSSGGLDGGTSGGKKSLESMATLKRELGQSGSYSYDDGTLYIGEVLHQTPSICPPCP